MTNKAGEQPTITQSDYTWADWQLAEQCVSAANVVTCDGYYEVDIEKVAETLAKARTTSLAAQDMVDCETCCGNGEVVTDWERYKHPHDGDVGDEAVAECQDCDGNGKIEAPSLAAQDGLVEALGTIVFMMGNVNHDTPGGANDALIRGGMLMDCKAVAEAALSAIKGDKS